MNNIEQFVGEVTRLGAGEQSLLRQCAASPLSSNISAFDLFTSIYWRLDRRGLDRYSLWVAMTLYPWNSLPGGKGCFGAAWAKIRPAKAEDQLRHDARLNIIVSAETPALHTLLLEAVRVLERKKVAVDWTVLISDLHDWNGPRAGVRQRWAGIYLEAIQQGDSNVRRK